MPSADLKRVRPILAGIRSRGRRIALETEGLAVVRELGLAVPEHLVVPGPEALRREDLARLPGERVVVKVLSPEVLHKSDEGGVAVVAKAEAAEALAAMERRFAGRRLAGFSVNEHVPHGVGPGDELLLGMRWTPDFGPVVTLGLGGIYAEALAGALGPERGTAILSPRLAGRDLTAVLEGKLPVQMVTGALRGQPERLSLPALQGLLKRWLAFAAAAMPAEVEGLEVNPLVVGPRGPTALDALLELGPGAGEEPPPEPGRPLAKLERLLRPRSMAVIGVSRHRNPGRVILENVLAMGFDRQRLYVIKPGVETLAGCRCVPDVASLPEPVDLLVVAVDAARAPAVVAEAVDQRKAESVILIPGGMGERNGSEGHAREVRRTLLESRGEDWRGPVVNGGNCLGVRSLPGRYDTLFIPRHKLRFPQTEATPLALLSQSGAFAVARASKLPALNPRYAVTLGNQIDLTLGDYLTYLADDPEVEVFACYVEGFRPGDGERWLEAAGRIVRSGRPVVLYRAGRTAAGARATASHTASIAGDYAVTRELARAAGAVVAESLADFEDLVRLFCLLRGKEVEGWRLGALSNAGFECVAIADNLGPFRLAGFSATTEAGLADLLREARIDSIVEVRNPLDVTPILSDAPFAAAARLVLEDPGVDVGLVGCVPLTGALATLAPGEDHAEDAAAPEAVPRRLVDLWAEGRKAWVAVVDSGPPYDAMARLLEDAGIPTFRTADRALRLLATYCSWRLRA